MTPGGLFHHLSDWDPEPLRDRLRKGGFHLEALETLGMPERWLRSSIRRAALLGHAPEGTPINTLIRLFTLGDEIDGQSALHALGDAIHGLLEIGFLDAGGGSVRSRYQLIPVASGWMAGDFHKRQGEDVADYVMGIGPSSILLDSLAPRIPGKALELASGIGWLSGNLAKAGMQVVATDLNPRALDLGRFSARLNGINGIDFRQGDGFSTVVSETFDLIVSNPPYVQSPGGNMCFRESTRGDPICARLLREIPNHLAPDGIAIVLINWSHATDDDWQDGPLSWVPAEGTRRWLFQSDCSSPADYAWTWINGDLRFTDETAAAEEMRRWLEFYRESGVQRISGGFMLVQQCEPGGEWTRAESRAPDNIDASSGPDLMRVIRNQTWLATEPDLLSRGFTVPEGIRAEARMCLAPGGWTRETIRLISPARLSYDGQIDENILRLLAILNEGGTPAMMVREIQTKPEFAAMEDLPERIAALVRDLVRHGMLVPRP
jgi:methylase of polypeptide subunit release factors